MTYFADLAPYDYSAGRGDVGFSVGWLDKHHDFEKWNPPPAFVDALRALTETTQVHKTRGYHCCEFCESTDGRPIDQAPLGSLEIKVTGSDGRTYFAPDLIYHYVTAHRYRPPDSFVSAVLRDDGAGV